MWSKIYHPYSNLFPFNNFFSMIQEKKTYLISLWWIFEISKIGIWLQVIKPCFSVLSTIKSIWLKFISQKFKIVVPQIAPYPQILCPLSKIEFILIFKIFLKFDSYFKSYRSIFFIDLKKFFFSIKSSRSFVLPFPRDKKYLIDPPCVDCGMIKL